MRLYSVSNDHSPLVKDYSQSTDSHCSNLNLNQNCKRAILIPVQTRSKSSKKNNWVSGSFEGKQKLEKWNKSTDLRLNSSFTTDKVEPKKNSKKKCSNSDDSTLSLHISAYENSNEAVAFDSVCGKKGALNRNKINLNNNNVAKFQHPFEFPRQQHSDKEKAPEVAQFRASQHLINPNPQTYNPLQYAAWQQQFAQQQQQIYRSSVGIATIGEIAHDDLAAAQNLGFLQLIAELVHRVIDVARSSANIKKLGKDSVVEAISRFIEVVNNVLLNIGSNDATPLWVENGGLEDLAVAFPLSSCVFRKNLTTQEIQAYSKLFTIKGDLCRYRSNINKDGNYDDAIKSYWKAFSFDHGHGIIFNQLGVIASACDNSDRLSPFFFFFRALYALTSFQNAKEFLMTKLGAVTDKMIQSDFSKYSEIFKNPSVSDTNGIFASSVKNSGPQEYYFPWFKKSPSQPSWKTKLSKLSPQIVCKIHNDNFFHMINLLCTKQSHQTLFPTCERFLALTQFLLDSELLTSKQVLQISTIFLLALKSRDDQKAIVDENFKVVSKTFLFFVGLLLSKMYDYMEIFNMDNLKFEDIFLKINTVLPSLMIIECYWESIIHLFPSTVYLSPSFTFDFSVIRKKISKLGIVLKDYLTNLKIEIRRTKLDDTSENTYLPPEIILCCMGNQFLADCNPLQLSSASSYNDSVTFQSFLIRASVVQELLVKMVNKGFFGLTSTYVYSPGKNDLSTFEIFALAYNKGSAVYAVYPEYIALDTNTIIDEYEKLMAFTQHGMKFIIPTVVWSELQSISRDKKKDETIRLSAKNAADLISKTITNRSNDFQIYNFYGERKFDLELTARDIAGLNNKTGRERARDNNDDFIISICRKIEDILGSTTTKNRFYDSKIIVRNVVLLTEDRILRIKARSENVLTCGFSDFFTWFNNCITSDR